MHLHTVHSDGRRTPAEVAGRRSLRRAMLPRSAAFGWLLVPLALSSTPLWSLLHESIHGSLLRGRAWNDRLDRVLAIGYGAPFVLLKSGHLLHHRFSRTPGERTEVYDPARTNWRAQAPAYYLRLFGGLYLAEVSSVLLVLAPHRLWRRLARRLESADSVTAASFDAVAGRRLGQFRLDAGLVILVRAAAFVAYGPRWSMLAAALAARAVVVSVTDNANHYGTALDEPLEAMNLRLPRALEVLVLAFNLHGVHHGIRVWPGTTCVAYSWPAAAVTSWAGGGRSAGRCAARSPPTRRACLRLPTCRGGAAGRPRG